MKIGYIFKYMNIYKLYCSDVLSMTDLTSLLISYHSWKPVNKERDMFLIMSKLITLNSP